MERRPLGSKGPEIPVIGLGCWQLGGGWAGAWEHDTAQEILEAAYKSGVRFIDTADVYGGGESERSVGEFRRKHPDVTIATKLGRDGIYPDGYTQESLRDATRASLERLGMDALDLTQLHCVPTDELRRGRVFDWLRTLRSEGLIKRWGASVESVEEGFICLEQDDCASLQVIFNIFRQKPARELIPAARERGVGIIVRLPFASGLLTGKITRETEFAEDDHRNFNRDGAAFNVGETFAGLPFEKGVELAEAIRDLVPDRMSFAEMSLRWILDQPGVSVVIPGASRPEQAIQNARPALLEPLSQDLHRELGVLYENQVRNHIRGPY